MDEPLLFIVTLLFFGILSVIYYFKNKFEYWKNLGVAGPEPDMLFGNLREVILQKKTVPEVYDVLYKKYDQKDYFGIYSFWKPLFVVKDPVLIKNILEKDFDYFHDRTAFKKPPSKTDSILYNVFTHTGSMWKTRRNRLSKLFTPIKLKEYLEDMKDSVERMMKEMGASIGEDLEVSELVKKYTTQSICRQLYGLDVTNSHLFAKKFVEYSEVFARPSLSVAIKIIFSSTVPRLFQLFGIKLFPGEAYEHYLKIFNDMKLAKKEGQEFELNLLGFITKQVEDEVNQEDRMDIDEAIGNMYVFFGASYDTSVLTTCHVLIQLSLNVEVQEKARNEVIKVLKGSKEITYEHISEMKYLDAVICETLRMYPAVGVLNRTCTKPYKINEDLILPVGTAVDIPVASVHMDPKNFPQPRVFLPERFYNSDDSRVWINFGMGPRMCIGMRFAKMAIKFNLARTLLQFDILLSEKMKIPMRFDPKVLVFTVRPMDGFWLKLKKKDTN